MVTVEQAKERFTNLIRATREADPQYFTLEQYFDIEMHPGCPLGNYIARSDLQSDFNTSDLRSRSLNELYLDLLRHFRLNASQGFELFNPSGGCGGAQTPEKAAIFLEEWSADHEIGWDFNLHTYWKPL